MAKTSLLDPPFSILHPHCIFIAGPTAVGKSEIALLLAAKINGEIISVDSMQVYDGLDKGTAKPSVEERKRIPHHLIDVADLTEPFDAAKFVQLANAAMLEIESRGKTPVFCGGTGLYFKALLEGLGNAPPADEKLRSELAAAPLPELLRELAERDPATFEKIDRKNPRRVIRAVEVVRLTGRKFSEQRADWEDRNSKINSQRFYGFTRANEELLRRIDDRVETMFRRGLVEETRGLLARGLAENKTAMQALGYRQVVEHLHGKHSLPETVELVKIKTRQYAKRQMTWFRRQMDLTWINLKLDDSPEASAERMFQCVTAGDPA